MATPSYIIFGDYLLKSPELLASGSDKALSKYFDETWGELWAMLISSL